jgi:hypothetical protein
MIALKKKIKGRENLLRSQLVRDCKLQTFNNNIMLVQMVMFFCLPYGLKIL